MSRIRWNPDAPPAENAARELPRLMADYFAGIRKALAADPKPSRLHRLRLASKKARYTLELFEPCYGKGFEQRMEALKDVQTLLGDVADATASARLVRDAIPKSDRRKALRAYLKTRAAEKAAEFRVHWVEQFDAPGRERWWTDFLAKPRRAR